MGGPSGNGCWAFGGLWAWWPMESSVSQDSEGNPNVNTKKNLLKPWVLSTTEDFYCICGVNSDDISDASYTVVNPLKNSYPAGNLALTPTVSKANNFVKGQQSIPTTIEYNGPVYAYGTNNEVPFTNSGYIEGSKIWEEERSVTHIPSHSNRI